MWLGRSGFAGLLCVSKVGIAYDWRAPSCWKPNQADTKSAIEPSLIFSPRRSLLLFILDTIIILRVDEAMATDKPTNSNIGDVGDVQQPEGGAVKREVEQRDSWGNYVPKNRDRSEPSEPFITTLFFILSGLSSLGGIILCSELWSEDPVYGMVALALGFVQAALFAAVGYGLLYLKQIVSNTDQRNRSE